MAFGSVLLRNNGVSGTASFTLQIKCLTTSSSSKLVNRVVTINNNNFLITGYSKSGNFKNIISITNIRLWKKSKEC